MNLSRVRNKNLQACMREISYLAAISEFEVLVVHVEGTSNILPDLLSRWHLGQSHRDRFEMLTQDMSTSEVYVSTDTFSFTGEWI